MPQDDSQRILARFGSLLGAHWVREGLRAVFLVCLARSSATLFGQFMLAMSVGSVLQVVTEFGFNPHLVRRLSRRATDPGRAIAQVTVLKGALFSLAWFGVWVLVCGLGYDPTLRAVVLVIATAMGVESLASSFLVALQVSGRQAAEARIRSAAAAIGFGCGLPALRTGAASAVVAFYPLVESLVTATGAMRTVMRRNWTGFRTVRARHLLRTFRLSLVFGLMETAAIVYNKANVFFLERASGVGAVAQYTAAWNIVDGVSILVSNLLLRNVLFPLFARLWRTDRNDALRVARDAARWLLLAAGPAVFILCSESDRILPLLYGPGYGDAVRMQRALSATVVFAFLHNLAAYLMISVGRQRLLTLFYVTGLIVNLTGCAWLIPAFGQNGAAGVLVFTKGLVALLSVGYCQWRFRLIPMRSGLELAGALLLGAGAYALGQTGVPRLMAEALALMPVAGLGIAWRRRAGSPGHNPRTSSSR